MPEREWCDDGHILVVVADGPFPEDGDVRWSVECPSNCTGPYLACDDCMGSGYVHDDDDDEQACSSCDETGKHDGEHYCWFQHGLDVWDALDDCGSERYKLGRFRMLYRTEGSGEDFFAEVRRGDELKAGSL